jgi:hypothetical protein
MSEKVVCAAQIFPVNRSSAPVGKVKSRVPSVDILDIFFGGLGSQDVLQKYGGRATLCVEPDGGLKETAVL